ncbi:PHOSPHOCARRIER PROTEIN HPR (HISTIDINE-CONTAINING PROTEIN) [Mycoplasmopsis pulmonis]|uniref:Phosphocarrier protein HPr n=1 Tax=Mycoplasmopsis pulmonis (strain UAB CTIP) TaxID=272635 RepID=Q98PW6_MYCPU|nr:HPr family phosphocarrier protein [Mycoplasmopsis pulmonis]MDZ7293596.1 HPr family phosphocarrier protein [Mycoplasmopsis pulmonis]CAC13776.1 PHOSPHOCARRIER PROTEIN HPR (HISTIDINE-CONTAINING PROTEIN) [Mycoplasmopsis pulmonis]VEU68364.1 phosphocarrier protein HPr (histidine-containing protein) [Mycoplasmopsis pulmonis]
MEQFKAKIIDPIGLHARPASLLTKEASKYKSNISLLYKDRQANLKSIMNIMALGVKEGAEIEVKADGEDEKEAINAIKAVMVDNKII